MISSTSLTMLGAHNVVEKQELGQAHTHGSGNEARYVHMGLGMRPVTYTRVWE